MACREKQVSEEQDNLVEAAPAYPPQRLPEYGEFSPAEPEVNIPGDYVEWVEVYDAHGNIVELTDAQHDALVDKANEMLPEWNQEDRDHAMEAWEDARSFGGDR